MAIGPATGRSQLRMEVLRRIPLGPRQGIAVVRIGTQTVAVSVGDGGVRQLLVLEPEDMADETVNVAAVQSARDFRALLRDGIRSAGLPIGALLIAAASVVSSTQLSAQQQPARRGQTTITPNAGPLVVPQGVRGVPVQPQASAIAPRSAAVAAPATIGGPQTP